MNCKPQVSVVIPTFQRRASVERLLRAMSRQSLPPDRYEVIVSMDGSHDGTQEMVSAFPSLYRLRAIWQPNSGRAAACNAGICAAEGNLIVLLDDDMEPTPELLAEHSRAHEAEPRLGVLGAVPIRLDESSSPAARYIGAKFNDHLARLARPGHEFKLRDFYSGNFSIRRDLLLQAGLFDETFKIYGNEDLELWLRLKAAGVRLVYNSAALAYQYNTKDLAGLAGDQIAKGRTAVLFASKHPAVFPELKLSTYGQASYKWRIGRSVLLTMSRLWGGTPDLVIRLISGLEQRRARDMSSFYSFSLDFFFWSGADQALRANRQSGKGLTSLALQQEAGRS